MLPFTYVTARTSTQDASTPSSADSDGDGVNRGYNRGYNDDTAAGGVPVTCDWSICVSVPAIISCVKLIVSGGDGGGGVGGARGVLSYVSPSIVSVSEASSTATSGVLKLTSAVASPGGGGEGGGGVGGGVGTYSHRLAMTSCVKSSLFSDTSPASPPAFPDCCFCFCN